MRAIEHGSLEANRAGSRICCEQLDDFLRRHQLLGARHERLVDDVDLSRMDRQHAAVPGAPHLLRTLAKPRFIAEVTVDRLDGIHAGSRGAKKAEAACQLVRELIAAVSVPLLPPTHPLPQIPPPP